MRSPGRLALFLCQVCAFAKETSEVADRETTARCKRPWDSYGCHCLWDSDASCCRVCQAIMAGGIALVFSVEMARTRRVSLAQIILAAVLIGSVVLSAVVYVLSDDVAVLPSYRLYDYINVAIARWWMPLKVQIRL